MLYFILKVIELVVLLELLVVLALAIYDFLSDD